MASWAVLELNGHIGKEGKSSNYWRFSSHVWLPEGTSSSEHWWRYVKMETYIAAVCDRKFGFQFCWLGFHMILVFGGVLDSKLVHANSMPQGMVHHFIYGSTVNQNPGAWRPLVHMKIMNGWIFLPITILFLLYMGRGQKYKKTWILYTTYKK